ncbi:MAG: acyl-CoA thioesterase [Flavobacteriales bacterium]
MLKENYTQRVRFDEVDALGIVWHGHYVKYLEDGREAWGRKYGLTYMGMYHTEGFAVPVVDLKMKYKRPLKYEEHFTIETCYVPCDAAKLILRYRILNAQNEEVMEAESTQVFLSKAGELQLSAPDFFEAWKQRMGLI